MKEAQARIQELLNTLVEEGRERGLQLAVYREGRLVIDCWAGWADPDKSIPVTGDTLFPVFSTSKGVTATIIHRLVEQGTLAYDTPISHYWPEFAARGKGAITLRQALNHSSGIPQMPGGMTIAEMCDWDTICAAVADLEPLWEPGTRQEYHAMTYGWILGETARRADGRPFETLLEEEIRRPLGTPDIYMGIPDEVEPRVALLEEHDRPPSVDLPPDARPQSVPNWVGPLSVYMNRPDARRAAGPGSNGIMTARAIAKHYAALLPGGVEGIELLPESRVKEAATLSPAANPYPDAPALSKGLGYSVVLDEHGKLYRFGHAGYGGAEGFAIPAYKVAVGFAKNLFSQNGATSLILEELQKALKG
jgi:CubicO group peptidase (beta-lactamase class C family)